MEMCYVCKLLGGFIVEKTNNKIFDGTYSVY